MKKKLRIGILNKILSTLFHYELGPPALPGS